MVTILMQRSAHTSARLSPYFTVGILQPLRRSERGRFLSAGLRSSVNDLSD